MKKLRIVVISAYYSVYFALLSNHCLKLRVFLKFSHFVNSSSLSRSMSEPKKGQFTLDSTCMEIRDSSLIMKIQYKVTESIIAKSFGGKKDYSDPAFKMMMICATDCPLRATVISARGSMNDQLAQGLPEMANGHFLRGVRAMLGK